MQHTLETRDIIINKVRYYLYQIAWI